MQKIYFNKMIQTHESIDELLGISVDESIQYLKNDQGINAKGSILINGEYKHQDQKKELSDHIDIDIFANNQKIESRNEFLLKIEDFDYQVKSGILYLMIEVHVLGVQDAEDHYIDANEGIKKDDYINHIDRIIEESVEPVLSKEEEVETIYNVEKNKPDKVISQTVETKIKDEPKKEDVGYYYFYIVKSGDQYDTISKRYQIEEQVLRDYNHNKPIEKGTIIIVPYVL